MFQEWKTTVGIALFLYETNTVEIRQLSKTSTYMKTINKSCFSLNYASYQNSTNYPTVCISENKSITTLMGA